MSVTETRPDHVATATADAAPAPDRRPLPEPGGLHGWVTTADHKRVGRLWIVTALAFLVVGTALGAVLGAERVDPGFDLLDADAFGQVYTLHGEVTVLLFLVPFFLGLATHLVPLQVGSPAIAFPRGAATAYWTYLVSGLVLLGAYLADGGPTGGSEVGTDLYLLSLGTLLLATMLALLTLLATVTTLRAPGLSLARAPLFSWAVLVGGGLTLLSAPVLLARLVELYVAHHFGGSTVGYGDIEWFWALPQAYLLVVPAAGIAAEVVPVMTGSRYRSHGVVMGVIALGALLGFGAFAQVDATFDDLLYVGMGLAAVLPALALVALLGDAARRGHLSAEPPFLLGMGAAVLLLLGALAGATSAIDALELRGTSWQAGQVHLTIAGAGTLAALAGLWYWAPKLWGVHLGRGSGRVAFAAVLLGSLLLAAPELVNGLVQDLPRASAEFDDDDLTMAMNGAGLAGGALTGLGVLIALVDVWSKAARHKGLRAVSDPWGGHTLEWATGSPPPPGNFTTALPPLTTAAPVLDAREAQAEVTR